jgi:Uma2 family endonuclease
MSTAFTDTSAEIVTADDLFRLSVEKYHRIGKAGILTHEDHVELLDGLIVQKTDYRVQSYASILLADEAYYRFSVAQYDELVAHGIIDEDDPVELLDGLLVRKMGKNPPHRSIKRLLIDALRRLIPGGWYVDEQEPILLTSSEPEPDAAIIRGDPRDHLPHPPPEAIALVVEVSDTSLRRDRKWKRQLYAKAAIPNYWVVNVVDGVIEVYADIADGDYAKPVIVRPGEKLPVVLDEQVVGAIDVKEVLAWSRNP